MASAPASAQEEGDSTNTIIVSKSGGLSVVFGQVALGVAKGGYVIVYVGTPYALHVQPAGNPNVNIRLSFSGAAERMQINITATHSSKEKGEGPFKELEPPEPQNMLRQLTGRWTKGSHGPEWSALPY